MKKMFLLVLVLVLIQKYSNAQRDTAFWFAAPDVVEINHPLYGQYDRPIYLRLTSFSALSNVTISIPANPAFIPINITIPANSTSTVDLTTWINMIENFEPDNINNKGIYIRASTDITAYYEVNSITCNCNPEFFSLKGKNAIGNNFYVPSQTTWAVDTVRHPPARAGFVLVATQNNTTITITLTKPLIGRPANIPFTITLNQGQSYACIALYRNGPSMLNGSKVDSDKPISLTAYEDVLFSDGACADLAGDQLIPTSIYGTEFAVVRGNLTTRDKVIITATQNNTNVYLNGNATPAATINAGQSYEYDLTPPAPTLYIKTDKISGVFHYTGTGCEVGAAVIPKLTCTGSSSVSLVRTSNGGNASVMLVTKNGNQGSFLVNGVAGIITAADFSPIIGTAGAYVYAKKDVTASMPLNTATTFTNTAGKFQLGFFNVTASNGGCMYGFFSDFKKSNVSNSQEEICRLDSVQLNAIGGITYQWSPATGLSNPNISNPKASPALTTDYKVVITDVDGCVDSAFVKVIVNSCSLACNNWLNTQSLNSNARVGDLDISGNQLTVEVIFNRTAPVNTVGGYGFLVSKHTGPSNVNYALWPEGCAITTTNGEFFAQENCSFELNKTYHVAMVYDGTSLKYYRNGFLHSQTPVTGNLILNDLITTIGQNVPEGAPTIFPFIGNINEVRIWNVARSQAQIQMYMNASLPAPTTQTGLKGYYIFDNLINKQGNAAYNATLSGAATINSTNPNCSFSADSCGLASNISSVINDYTPVLALDICNNKITVEDAAKYNAGDTVLLIQMKGAVIDSTNTAAFGTITDYKNAGNYEFNYVKSKAGNVIELKNVLTRQYDIPVGKVQLIRVPYYNDVTVTNTLTCLPWDGNKGGVLVLNAQNSISLNADIDVSGKGFIGSPGYNPGNQTTACFSNNYFYPPNTIMAAPKGESIASISSDKGSGKGKLAGGGGGGNGHNSGGGGGGNAGGGGFGGYQLEPCGSAPYDNRGIGGTSLTYSTAANKIFMGGGGGAGHQDNLGNIPSGGGNGGGIVILLADKITSNSKKVIANGNDGVACTIPASPNCHDGMGGGGAGGTVLLSVNLFNDNSVAEVKGGKGADMTGSVPLGGRIGAGGGGGGGLAFLKTPAVPANLVITNTGGLNGVLVTDGNSSWGATAGANGANLFNLVLPVTNTAFKPNIDSVRINESLLGCNSFDFRGLAYINNAAISSWQWYFGDGGTANTQNTTYIYGTPGIYTVKLVVTDINGCKDSILKDITTGILPFNKPPDKSKCGTESVQLDGNNGTTVSYLWNPATYLSSTTIINPIANPPATIVYSLKITNTACGYDSTFDVIVTVLPKPAVTAGKLNDIDCANRSARLFASGGNTYSWSPTTGLNDPNIPNPVATIRQTQKYFVNVSSGPGCTNIDSVTVLVDFASSLARYMPNAFTPNGDGLNDCYGLKNWMYVKKLEFRIFNRYGEQVFGTSDPSRCWDGKYKGKIADQGSYVYYIKAETNCGTEEQKGTFLLIR